MIGYSPIDLGGGQTVNCRCDVTPIITEKETEKFREENEDWVIRHGLSPIVLPNYPWPHTEMTQEMKDDWVVPWRLSLDGEYIDECTILSEEQGEKYMEQWENRHLIGRKRKKNRS